MFSKTFVLSFVVTTVCAGSAFANTNKNAENYMAQQLAQAYTGVQDEQVDSRIGGAIGALAGCQIGEMFQQEGFATIGSVTRAEITSRLTGTAQKAALIAADKALAQGPSRLTAAMEKNCDRSKWPKKYGQHNLNVAAKIIEELKPLVEQNRDAVIRGEFDSVLATLVGEGTKIHSVLTNMGKLKLDSDEAKDFAAVLDGKSADDLLRLARALSSKHELACEPNSFFRARQVAEKVRNSISNKIEMTMSPIETTVEKIVEKLMGGDGVGKLMQDESVAITKNDDKLHDHLQHEIQNSACFAVETEMELVNRELRGTKLGQNGRDVTPEEIRTLNPAGRGLKGLLYEIELSAPANVLRKVGSAR